MVGINAYPEMGALQGAEADARDFYAWVTDPAGGGIDDPSRALLILSQAAASGNVYDTMPARHEVEKFFYKVDAAANANGLVAGWRLYMFFSGHGFAPSFDQSAMLMANATRTAPDNFACRNWADRLFMGDWFQEVILFQDTCRTRFTAVTLIPSFLSVRNAPGQARFYALARQDGKLALEKPDGIGGARGVFSMTLMEALRGRARDSQTGALTS